MTRFLPKFPIFVQDWLSSLRILSMSAAQEGAFLRLCLIQWQEGGLPDDEAAMLRLGRLDGVPADHRVLLDAFLLGEDGKRRNGKVARVRAEAEEFCDSQAEKGRKGNAARWGSPVGSQRGQSGDDSGIPQDRPPTPTPTPTPKQTQTTGTPPYPPANGGAPSPEPTTRAPRRAPAQDAEVVAGRPEYRAFLADIRAAEAWQSWLEWTGTAGARAKRPIGQQAARILNEGKREGPARFAAAVDCAIAGNYLAPTYRDAPRTNGHAHDKPHVSNVDRALAGLERLGVRIEGEPAALPAAEEDDPWAI